MLINLCSIFLLCVTCKANGQLLRPDLMNLGTYNPETKKYEKNIATSSTHKPMLGEDDHDLKPHKTILGGGDHDYKPHKKNLLGSGDHDRKTHRKTLLGADEHDYKTHKKVLFGGGEHDRKHHRKPKFGEDDHDYKSHKKSKFGEDDHDLKPHKKPMFGGDDHDLKPHKKPMFGGDDHDLKPHKKPIFGGDDHDIKPHKKALLGRDDHDLKPHKKHHLGGDDHDYKPHKPVLLGKDDHDLKSHKKNLLGGEHDFKLHKKHRLGENNHDYRYHKTHKQLAGKNTQARPHLEAFGDFVEKFERVYETKREFKKRFHIFRSNMKKIELLLQNEMGTAEYGITKFADWTIWEFRKLLGLKPELKPSVSLMKAAEIPKVDDAPESFDWRDKGVVTEVKNQGMCGSCWAFSVTGNVEGQWALKHKQLFSLSEQELVDCDDTDQGCNGGMPENAYKAISDLGGLETETGYPYEGKDDKCHLEPQKIKVKVNGSVELPEDEDKLKNWLLKNGPISIGINANALQFYVGGVSHPFKFLCNPDSLDHGMLIVGYGVHTTKYLHRVQPYWLVKNSWGKDWGEQGYYRVFRGDGTCGVNKMATSAVVP